MNKEKNELWELYNNGLISESTFKQELLILELKDQENDKTKD